MNPRPRRRLTQAAVCPPPSVEHVLRTTEHFRREISYRDARISELLSEISTLRIENHALRAYGRGDDEDKIFHLEDLIRQSMSDPRGSRRFLGTDEASVNHLVTDATNADRTFVIDQGILRSDRLRNVLAMRVCIVQASTMVVSRDRLKLRPRDCVRAVFRGGKAGHSFVRAIDMYKIDCAGAWTSRTNVMESQPLFRRAVMDLIAALTECGDVYELDMFMLRRLNVSIVGRLRTDVENASLPSIAALLGVFYEMYP